MSCRCGYCLWSAREPNELRRLETDIEEQRSREFYLRLRRAVQSADAQSPSVAGGELHAAPWAVPGAAVPAEAGLSLPLGDGCAHAAPGAWGDVLADGDGWVTAPGSGESGKPHADDPRPVRIELDPSDVRAGLAAPCPAVASSPVLNPFSESGQRPSQAAVATNPTPPPTTAGGLGTGAPVSGVAFRGAHQDDAVGPLDRTAPVSRGASTRARGSSDPAQGEVRATAGGPRIVRSAQAGSILNRLAVAGVLALAMAALVYRP